MPPETFEKIITDKGVKNIVDKITKIGDLAAPPICFPDIHMKPSMETPTSMAVATNSTIIPTLITSTVGCGMGLIATNLTKDDITVEFCKSFSTDLMSGFSHEKKSRIRTFLTWAGLYTEKKKAPYDLSLVELQDVIEHGAHAVVEKYGFTLSVLNHIEKGGNIMDDEACVQTRESHIIPRSGRIGSLHNLGYWPGGNHFIEIQYIETIQNHDVARSWGLHEGQVVIMYHGGEGSLGFYVGRYFSRRKKHGLRERLLRFPAKFLFHFLSLDGLIRTVRRWKYYFIFRPLQEIPLHSREGERLMTSLKASMNYGYASRLAIVARIRDALSKTLSQKNITTQLVWDSTHNAITEETVQKRPCLIHRNGTVTVEPGRPVIISGTNTTQSYLGCGEVGAEYYLYSADHGVGVSHEKKVRGGEVTEHGGRHTTYLYHVSSGSEKILPHTSSDALDEVTKTLEKHGIVSPVARMRPLAAFKA